MIFHSMNNIDFISDWASSEDSIRPLAFEHTSQALIVIDPYQNRFIDLNISASQLLRYERHELIAKTVTSVFGHINQLPHLMAFTDEALSKGYAWNNELYAFDKEHEKYNSMSPPFVCLIKIKIYSFGHWSMSKI